MWAALLVILFGQSSPDRAIQTQACVDKAEQAEIIKEGSEKAPDLIQPAVEGAIGAATDIRNKLEGKEECAEGLPKEQKKGVESPKAQRSSDDAATGRRVRADVKSGTATSGNKK